MWIERRRGLRTKLWDLLILNDCREEADTAKETEKEQAVK